MADRERNALAVQGPRSLAEVGAGARSNANLSVSGTRYYKAAELLQKGSLTSGLAICFEHEPNNPYDKNAVAVRLKSTKEMLGHIPRSSAAKYVELIKSGKVIDATIVNITKNSADITIGVRVTTDLVDGQLEVHHSSHSQQPNAQSLIERSSFRQRKSESSLPTKPRVYRTWRAREWAGTSSPSKYSILVEMFGSAVSEIRYAFLHLDERPLSELMSDYGAIHGRPAEDYARKTFPKWLSGATTL